MSCKGLVQFNASTGKLIFNSSTKKDIYTPSFTSLCDDCVTCKTPEKVRITLSGVTGCTDCYPFLGGGRKHINGVFNGDLIIPFIGVIVDEGCVWNGDTNAGQTYTFERYTDILCNNFLSSTSSSVVNVNLSLNGEALTLAVVWDNGFSIFFGQADRDSECVSGSMSNQNNCNAGTAALGGTAIIEAVE